MYYVVYVPMLKIYTKPRARKEIDEYVRMEKQTPVVAHKKTKLIIPQWFSHLSSATDKQNIY